MSLPLHEVLSILTPSPLFVFLNYSLRTVINYYSPNLMESNQDEDSKSSSSEGTERSNDEMGMGRSYECVFCKRGFTTAQALGGHMNIHRKDRAKKLRPSSSSSSSISSFSSKVDHDQEYASFRSYPPIQTYPTHYAAAQDHEVHANYETLFPASTTWGFGFGPHHAPQNSDDHDHHHMFAQSPQLLNPFGDDNWRSTLSLQIGPSHNIVDDLNYNKEKREDGNDEAYDDGLDLELRLGHDP